MDKWGLCLFKRALVPGSLLILLSSLASAAPLSGATAGPAEPAPTDIFIGIMAMEDGQPVLTRCDLVQTRYRLKDAKGAVAVANFIKDGRTAYGEVIASYTEQNGQPTLEVSAIDGFAPDKNCHLIDAIDALDMGQDAKISADAAFVGHYYLSGVRETGSELLLRPDGTFEWYMSYGALDQSASGRWARQDQSIILTSQAPANDKPLYSFLDVEPWSDAAEAEMLSRENDLKAEAVRAECPFLTDSWVSAPSMATMEEIKETPTALRQKAADALGKAQAMQTQVEALAREVMALTPSLRAERHNQVMEMLTDWMEAREIAREAALKAGLAEPQFKNLTLPAACALPAPAPKTAPAAWAGGIGVRVMDLASRQGARAVEAHLQFADGKAMALTTAGRGLAIMRGPFASGVVKVTLHADYAPGRDASFDVPATRNSIIHFAIDASQLTQPAFSTLHLKIDGKALIPEEFGRGRYERGQ
jgi:hypothetical protein